ncbi:hypothetical protein SAY86_028423 [Trapa natans]|uniref:Uncharacterized protein n=1 Tax=Trapa natans TaxID=22666 RepID=A0AAN7RAQ4_TRANT|nr:hypothetical protein SAY86_028423 [Trapa natans]
MARSALLYLLLGDLFLALAMESEMSPSPSPSTVDKSSNLNRKLGLHQQVENEPHHVQEYTSPSPALRPGGGGYVTEHAPGEPSPVEQMIDGEVLNIQTKETNLKKHQKSVDKSVAGGAVILACLAVVFLGAIFCYIRATGRQKQDSMSAAA